MSSDEVTRGDYLYDEDPMPFHTGTPRPRKGLLLGILGGTVALGVLMVVTLPLVKGSSTDQARDVSQVFVAALQQGDTETAYGLLCADETARLQPGDVAAAYLRPGVGSVVDVTDGEQDGAPVVQAEIRWVDGASTTTSELTLVPEGGAKVCGSSPAG